MDDRPALAPPGSRRIENPAPPDDVGEKLDWAEDDITGEEAILDPGIADDPGGDWVPDEEPWDTDGGPLPDAPDDSEAGPIEPDDAEPSLDLDEGEREMPVLPWSGTARLPDHGVDVPVILDPGSATSRWIVAAPAGDSAGDLRVEIGEYSARIRVAIVGGDAPLLVLGRDALSGRVLIRV